MRIFVPTLLLTFCTLVLAAPKTCKKKSRFPMKLDDSSEHIYKWCDDWKQLSQSGHGLYKKTESYAKFNDHNGCNAFYSYDYYPGRTLRIYGQKKADRGKFTVYVQYGASEPFGGSVIGQGDAYDANCQEDCQSQLIYESTAPQFEWREDRRIMVKFEADDRVNGDLYIGVDYIEWV